MKKLTITLITVALPVLISSAFAETDAVEVQQWSTVESIKVLAINNDLQGETNPTEPQVPIFDVQDWLTHDVVVAAP